MNSDMQLKEHVEDELSWEPSVNAASIGVAVKDAVVSLSGYVASYVEKHAAEKAVMRIHGVRALANDLEVKLPGDSKRSDADIARAAAYALEWSTNVPKDHVKANVTDGWINLEGTVDWNFQKFAAEKAVSHLMGVRGVVNMISVKPLPVSSNVKSQIEAALRRNAEAQAHRIQVGVHGNRVTLSGKTATMSERLAAEIAAWKAPGVMTVENNISVSPLVQVNSLV